jgi:hypothetical protein
MPERLRRCFRQRTYSTTSLRRALPGQEESEIRFGQESCESGQPYGPLAYLLQHGKYALRMPLNHPEIPRFNGMSSGPFLTRIQTCEPHHTGECLRSWLAISVGPTISVKGDREVS